METVITTSSGCCTHSFTRDEVQWCTRTHEVSNPRSLLLCLCLLSIMGVHLGHFISVILCLSSLCLTFSGPCCHVQLEPCPKSLVICLKAPSQRRGPASLYPFHQYVTSSPLSTPSHTPSPPAVFLPWIKSSNRCPMPTWFWVWVDAMPFSLIPALPNS